MLDRLRPGDMVTVTRIDRLARSTFDLFGVVKRIVDAKVQFRGRSISHHAPRDGGRLGRSIRPLRCLCVFALLFLVISGSPLRAAEVECARQYDGKPIPEESAQKLWPSGFRPVAGMCQYGYLHGTIAKGDYEKVRALLRLNQQTLNVFYFASPGGDVNETILIGRLFREYLITAWAPSQDISGSFFLATPPTILCRGTECVCASACALIWFGAVDRIGVVGLHRPRIDDPTFKTLAPDEAARVYRRALDDIAHYMNEMEAPHPTIDAMVATLMRTPIILSTRPVTLNGTRRPVVSLRRNISIG